MDYFKALIDWRKNTSFFMLVLLLITTEAPYLANLKNTPDSPWYNNINYILIILLTIPAILVGAYILFKRNYIPKAKNGKIGIVFCISYTEPQQYKTICDKFIKPFMDSIIIVEKSMKPRRDEKRYVMMGVKEFLLDKDSSEA